MSSLSKNAWLSADTQQPVEIHVPELGGPVKLRRLLQAEITAIPRGEKGEAQAVVNERFSVATLALSIVDDDGKQMFTVEEIRELRQKVAAVVWIRLNRKINALNGWSTDAEDDAKN